MKLIFVLRSLIRYKVKIWRGEGSPRRCWAEADTCDRRVKQTDSCHSRSENRAGNLGTFITMLVIAS